MASIGEIRVDITGSAAGLARASTVANRAMFKQSRATDKLRRGYQRMNRQLSRNIRGLFNFRNALGVAGGSSGLGLVVKNTLDYSSALRLNAARLGLNTTQLQKWRFAAKQNNIEQRQLDIGLQRFSRRVGEAQNGSGELLPTLQKLGIELHNVGGGARSISDVLDDFSLAVSKLPNASQQLAATFKGFDAEGATIVALFRDGPAALKKGLEEASANFVIGPRVLARAHRLADRFSALGQNLQASIRKSVLSNLAGLELVERQLSAKLPAAISSIASALTTIAVNIDKVIAGFKLLGGLVVFRFLSRRVVGVFNAVKTVIAATGTGARAASLGLGILGLAFTKLLIPVLAVEAAFAAFSIFGDLRAHLKKTDASLFEFVVSLAGLTGPVDRFLGPDGPIEKLKSGWQSIVSVIDNAIGAMGRGLSWFKRFNNPAATDNFRAIYDGNAATNVSPTATAPAPITAIDRANAAKTATDRNAAAKMIRNAVNGSIAGGLLGLNLKSANARGYGGGPGRTRGGAPGNNSDTNADTGAPAAPVVTGVPAAIALERDLHRELEATNAAYKLRLNLVGAQPSAIARVTALNEGRIKIDEQRLDLSQRIADAEAAGNNSAVENLKTQLAGLDAALPAYQKIIMATGDLAAAQAGLVQKLEQQQALTGTLTGSFGNFLDSALDKTKKLSGAWSQLGINILKAVQQSVIVKPLAGFLGQAASSLILGGGFGGFGGFGKSIAARASGGAVLDGGQYLVGENGAELLTMRGNGDIDSASHLATRLNGGGGGKSTFIFAPNIAAGITSNELLQTLQTVFPEWRSQIMADVSSSLSRPGAFRDASLG